MRVATHSGVFHADDVIAYLILRWVDKIDGIPSNFVRTRDQAIIDAADIAFDVGGVYDPDKGRYDHHQRGGAGARFNGVPYAAAGLIWRRYGFEFCDRYGPRNGVDRVPLMAAVDERVIQGIDALDNGACEGFMPRLRGTDVKIDVNTLSVLVSSFNPTSLIEDAYQEDFDDAFMEAANAIWPFFERLVIGEVSKLKAASIVRSCDHGDGIMVLDPFCQWQETVVNEMPHVQFVVFRNPEGTWMVQTVPAAIGSFDARKSLPESWAGLRDDAFAEVTGVSDAVFCHPARFICGARSRVGAMSLASLAL